MLRWRRQGAHRLAGAVQHLAELLLLALGLAQARVQGGQVALELQPVLVGKERSRPDSDQGDDGQDGREEEPDTGGQAQR